MRRLTLAALGTVSSLVLIFAYPTSHDASLTTASPASGSGGPAAPVSADDGTTANGSAAVPATHGDEDHGDDGGGGQAAAAAPSSAPAPAPATKPATGSATFTGSAVQTRWGVVQIQITVKNGKVTAADAVQHPTGGYSDEVNAYAVPILNAKVVSAQSARIDAVSGATVTSGGYVASLQSALDAARL